MPAAALLSRRNPPRKRCTSPGISTAPARWSANGLAQLPDGVSDAERCCPCGVPVVVDGEVIGGIGASFATPEQDEQVAKAGLAALGD
jgi:uncharacterized protein GlcG (DUF336 family)